MGIEDFPLVPKTAFQIFNLYQTLAILQKYEPVENIFIELGVWGNGKMSTIVLHSECLECNGSEGGGATYS